MRACAPRSATPVSWRRFCRIPLDGRVPHPATLMKLTTRCGEQAVAGLNEALWAKAAGQKLLRTARVRADTTVICANVAYPTDSGLLAKAVGKLVRAARRVQAAGGAPCTTMTDRRRAAARRMRQIAGTLRTRGKLSREESTQVIRRVTGQLAGLAEETAAEAAAVLRNGRLAVPRALSGRVRGRLRRALSELAVTIERTATLVAQARTRLAGQTPDGATRLVSLHDPDARPIRKGRIDRPVESGYRSPVTTTASSWTTPSNTAPPPTGRSLRPPSSGSAAAPAPRRVRSPLTVATAGLPSSAIWRTWACEPWRSPPGHDLRHPQETRAQPRLPPPGQVAHRLRRADQLPKAQGREVSGWQAGGKEPESGRRQDMKSGAPVERLVRQDNRHRRSSACPVSVSSPARSR
jgi:hypothetical protein